MKASSYQVRIVSLWPNSPDLAVARVADRVNRGGYHVPNETVGRRYNDGLRNLFQPDSNPFLYDGIWALFGSSKSPGEIILTTHELVRRSDEAT